MRVLCVCEESQAVTTELRKRGHTAFSCDLLPTSGNHPEWHIQADALEVVKADWDMVIAFPPCTHLASSGAAWFEQKRRDGRQQRGIGFFLAFTALDHVPRVAIENPVGIMSKLYRKPDQIIQPYQFGDPYEKRTCLWLKGLPQLIPTNVVTPPLARLQETTGEQCWSGTPTPGACHHMSVALCVARRSQASRQQWQNSGGALGHCLIVRWTHDRD